MVNGQSRAPAWHPAQASGIMVAFMAINPTKTLFDAFLIKRHPQTLMR